MMNISFMSVHHLVCHLDLKEMENHKVATALPDHFIILCAGIIRSLYQQVLKVV